MLSNSLGTNLGMWDDQLPSLVDRFRVLRYDQRGHGRSPAPPGPYTIAELAGDALDLLDRLGLERVSFCGVSLGGMTGMWLAVNSPERLDRLALCCTSAYLPPRENWTERAETVRARGMEAVVDAALERWFTPALAERRPDAVERTRRALLNVSAEGYAGCWRGNRRARPARRGRLDPCADAGARRRRRSRDPTRARPADRGGRRGRTAGGARARPAPGRCGAAR
jgi:3-oxoadipate enol-lactonase